MEPTARCARSSSTTSSWRATSWAILLGQLGGVEVIGQAGNGVEALTTIERLQPDLVFLDVQMPGLTGFEVARRLLDARGADAHHLRHRVRSARDRGVRGQRGRLPAEAGRSGAARVGGRARAAAHRSPIGRRSAAERQQRRAREDRPAGRGAAEPARAAGDQGRRAVPARAGRRNHLRLAGRRRHHGRDEPARGTSNYRTLDELQARLDPAVFWRVHRSHLVNINKIKEIVPWFSRNYILRMKDEKSTEIPVSRTQTRGSAST